MLIWSLALAGCTDTVSQNEWEFTEPQGEQAEEHNRPGNYAESPDCAEGVEPETEFERVEADVWQRTLPEHRDGDGWYQATVEIDASSEDNGDWSMELTQRFCHELEHNKALVGMRPEAGTARMKRTGRTPGA